MEHVIASDDDGTRCEHFDAGEVAVLHTQIAQELNPWRCCCGSGTLELITILDQETRIRRTNASSLLPKNRASPFIITITC